MTNTNKTKLLPALRQRIVNLGGFLFHHQTQALILTGACVAVDWMNWVAVTIMALMTLRRGPKAGSHFLAVIIIVNVLKYMVTQDPSYQLRWVVDGVIVWHLAWLLRYSVSWALTVEVAAAAAIVGVIWAHTSMDIVAWWETVLKQMIPVWSSWGLHITAPEQLIHQLAKMATGMMAAELLIGVTIKLLLARAWQSLLFNPGGLKQELVALRLHPIMAFALMLLIAGALAHSSLAFDILPVVGMLFFLIGLCFLHTVVVKRRNRALLLIMVYGLLVIIPIYVMMVLVAIAVFDSVFDLHKHFLAKGLV